jgi:hypothetical protein
MADTIHRFALNVRLDSEKKQFLTEYFYTAAEQRGVTRKIYRLSLDVLKASITGNEKAQQVMGLQVKEEDKNFKRCVNKTNSKAHWATRVLLIKIIEKLKNLPSVLATKTGIWLKTC